MKFPFLKQGLCLLLLLAALAAGAQEAPAILSIEERSPQGKLKQQLEEFGTAIVDINSSIHIRLHIDQIENEMFQMAGISSTDKRLQHLQELNRLLAYEAEISRMLNEHFRQSRQLTLAIRQEWARLSNEFIAKLKTVEPELYAAINQGPLADSAMKFMIAGGTLEEFTLQALRTKAGELRAGFYEELGMGPGADSSLLVYFRLGAFIKDREGGRPIHVENFDQIGQENYQVVETFGASISQAEFSALQQHARLSNSIETENNQAFKGLEVLLKQQLDSLSTARFALRDLRQNWQRLHSSWQSDPQLQPYTDILNNKINALMLVEPIYTTLANTFNQLSGAGSLPNFIQQVSDQSLGQLQTAISAASLPLLDADQQEDFAARMSLPDGVLALDTLERQSQKLVRAIQKDVGNITEFVKRISFMLGLKKASLENEIFSEKVKRFQPGNIPQQGFIELRYIGPRRPGDEILIKATLERGRDRRSAKFEERQLYRRYIRLERVAPFVRMSGSLILANPYNRANNAKVALENQYQFAAAYGVFLKWGSRKSRFYNDFLRFGLGLSFSSPDFNLDGTPEFGAGLVVTGLRDWISAGWGWNFGADAPYTFIGFNIPFTVAGFTAPSALDDR